MNRTARTALNKIRRHIINDADFLTTDEQIKTHIILPFIKDVLGYSTPATLRPNDGTDAPYSPHHIGYTCYGKDNTSRIIIEYAPVDTISNNGTQQIQASFSYAEPDIAVLTNGRTYSFYKGAAKRQLNQPFLVLDIEKQLKEYEEDFLELLSCKTYDLTRLNVLIKALPYLSAKNDDRTSSIKHTLKRKGQHKTKSDRAPTFRFSMVALKEGDIIYFIGDKSKTFVIDSDKTVAYNGGSICLSPLANILQGKPKDAPIRGPEWFTYDGVTTLKELRETL